MKDYRSPEHRREYFTALYRMNLEHGIMPGLVYLYMPALAEHYGWDDEQRLWFAFLNGCTQNPITSLRLFERLPAVPPAGAALTGFTDWFNSEWDTLQFDTDRRYQKKDTVEAIKSYAALVSNYGPQRVMLTNHNYANLWQFVREGYHSFGRLASFSYLEYVYLNGFGADCDDLLFEDKSGSRSHRNGMLFLIGKDELVWDKRLANGQDGSYHNFKPMCEWLDVQSNAFLHEFAHQHPGVPNVGRFTLRATCARSRITSSVAGTRACTRTWPGSESSGLKSTVRPSTLRSSDASVRSACPSGCVGSVSLRLRACSA